MCMCASVVQFLSINDPDYCYYYHISARYWINSVWLLACILPVSLSVRLSSLPVCVSARFLAYVCVCPCVSLAIHLFV